VVLLYWDIGRLILERQEREGWGAKVTDRLADDLKAAHPEMKGLSPRNLKSMRAFAAAWPDIEFVQQAAAQIPWLTTASRRPLPWTTSASLPASTRSPTVSSASSAPPTA
jgi:hypothetical protein